jgi:hypothetical protein
MRPAQTSARVNIRVVDLRIQRRCPGYKLNGDCNCLGRNVQKKVHDDVRGSIEVGHLG